MLVTTIVNFGCSPATNCGWLVIPLTANVESGQSSPSLSTGGGMTAAVAVGVSGTGGGSGGVGELTPRRGLGGAAAGGAGGLAAVFVSAPALLVSTVMTTAATAPMTTTAMASARPRR